MTEEILYIITDILKVCFNFIVGPVLSVVGFVLTVKGIQTQKKSKTIDWAQLQAAAKHLSKYVKKDMPDIVICPGQKGGTFAQLIADNLEFKKPIYTGFMVPVEEKLDNGLTENYFTIDTTKWHVFLPMSIMKTTNHKVLIIDDYVMSGDFLYKLKEKLVGFGYDSNNIKSCSIATTHVAKLANKAPDYYWKIVDAEDCYFPWGKAK